MDISTTEDTQLIHPLNAPSQIPGRIWRDWILRHNSKERTSTAKALDSRDTHHTIDRWLFMDVGVKCRRENLAHADNLFVIQHDWFYLTVIWTCCRGREEMKAWWNLWIPTWIVLRFWKGVGSSWSFLTGELLLLLGFGFLFWVGIKSNWGFLNLWESVAINKG